VKARKAAVKSDSAREVVVDPLAPGGGAYTHLNACSDSFYLVRYSEIDFKSSSPRMLAMTQRV